MRLWAVMGLAGLAACADPTEVVVFVDTTLGVPCQVDTFRIVVQGEGAPVEQVVPATDGTVSWTIERASGGDTFDVRVEAKRGGTTVASGRATASFASAASRQVVLFLTENCVGAECDFSETVGALVVPSSPTRASCQGIASRYTVQDQTGIRPFANACDLDSSPRQRFTTLDNDEVLVDDETIAGLLMNDFDFRLFGAPVNRVWVTDDGYISFGAEAEGATADLVVAGDEGITTAGHPRFAVMAFWEALAFPATGELCVAMQDIGGRNTLWVTWDNACLTPCPAGDQLTFTIGLEEVTNEIIVGFDTMNSLTQEDRARGARAVVGIMGEEGPACGSDECSATGFCADGVTPCGYAVAFSRTAQVSSWPATFVFKPVSE